MAFVKAEKLRRAKLNEKWELKKMGTYNPHLLLISAYSVLGSQLCFRAPVRCSIRQSDIVSQLIAASYQSFGKCTFINAWLSKE